MPGFILNDGAVVPPSVYSAMNTVLNKKLGTSQVYPPRDWAAIVKDLVPLPLKSASGSIAHFEDGADTVPLKSCTLTLTPTQSGTGDPSPTNPRPITGVSSVNVTSAGKNLVDSDDYYESYKQADGSYISKGSEANAVVIPILPALIGKQVTFSASLRKPEGSTIGAIRVICYVNGIQTNGNNVTSSDYTTSSVTFTPVTENDYVKISYASSGGQNMQYKDVQLELGSTATTYEPYTATLTPVSLGQTVYGGEVEAIGGTLTDKLGYGLLKDNAPNFTETISTNYTTYYARISGIYTDMKTSGFIEVYCDKFKGTKTPITSNYVCYIQNGYLNCRVSNGDFANAAAFKTWVQTNGLQLAYELADPVETTIDPHTINSRYGVNNLWHDGNGEIECEYYADPTLSTQ